MAKIIDTTSIFVIYRSADIIYPMSFGVAGKINTLLVGSYRNPASESSFQTACAGMLRDRPSYVLAAVSADLKTRFFEQRRQLTKTSGSIRTNSKICRRVDRLKSPLKVLRLSMVVYQPEVARFGSEPQQCFAATVSARFRC
jgi:hypothetical protein